ncbi:T9SS type A sorting domain-containing protein [Ignavibacterium sp.]|uniref:T9SS type A sorting domain-containing protein n=1 Tax=Ignavibacterium sp. TaxID=2651167 RepID=UPI00307DB6B5
MKYLLTFLLIISFTSKSFNQNRSIYIWETPVTYNINVPEELILNLRSEIDTLLKYQNYAPLRVYFGDIIWETYFSYLEPGRVIITLARAYNHLTPSQRTQVGNYIRTLLSDANASPWAHIDINNAHLNRTQGKRREYHKLDQIWGYDNNTNLNFRPVLHTLYGIWLYAFNSKDTAIIQENWNQIKQYYNEFRNRELNLLSGLSAAIAVARMAELMNDAQMLQNVTNHINSYLTFSGLIQSAKNFAYNGFNGWDAPYPYDTDRARNLIFMSWIFLNISPEICRFLDDYYQQETIQHHLNEVNKYPLWWVRSVPYWTRWTGDESVGLPSEVCGMASPIERWIMRRTPEQFKLYTRSAPYCLADSYWLEMLIDAIELYGQTSWVDVRTYNDSIPPSVINDLRVEYINSKGYLIWTTPSDNGLNGRPFNYYIKFSTSPLNDNQWNQYPSISYNKSIKQAGEIDTLLIPNLGNDSIYFIAVKSSDDFGNISEISNQVQFNTSLVSVENSELPGDFFVYPVYPNPFNPNTNIKFLLPELSESSILVYSITGELVDRVVENKILPAGEHSFIWNANHLPSGVYIIAVKVKSSKTYNKTIKAILLK